MKAKDYRLFRGALGAMAALLQLAGGRRQWLGRPEASTTHHWWVVSEVEPRDVLRVVEELDARYHVLADRRAKHAARSAGVGAATAHLVLHPRALRTWEAGEMLSERWLFDAFLLASSQIEPQMRNAHNRATALLWQRRYRLVRESGRWTWRFTGAERRRLEELMISTVRGTLTEPAEIASARIGGVVHEVLLAPRWRGIRRDVLEILELGRREVRRHRPELRVRIPTAAAVTRHSVHGFPVQREDRPERAHTLGAWLEAWEHNQPEVGYSTRVGRAIKNGVID